MLQTIIPAYLYQQYADDDNLAAFSNAFNTAGQYYLDWFASINLAYYPGLSGDLLNWVAEGVYGQARTSLAAAATSAVGPFGTLTFGSAPLKKYTPPSQTYYSLTDDAFQRILTWNFYKGDGRRFSMRWLKRRIMRFLLGVNGTDPQPWQPGFVVGCENTQPISVVVSSHIVTVSIDQVLLSSLTQLTPGILQIFQLAFEDGQAGPLELPLQYSSFVCNIVTSLSASAAPPAQTSAGTATSQNTGSSSVTVLGGSGSYTYAWTWLTGGTGLTINAPSLATTNFTGAAMTPGNTYSGTAQCLVTDTISTNTTTCQVTVSITCYGTLSASCSPSSTSVTGASASETTGSVTVTPSGGSGSYTYSWTWQSGGAGIAITASTSATTNFTGSGLSAGQTLTGTALCTVTDTVTSGQATTTCAVSVARVTAVSASASPTSVASSGTATTQTTPATTASASGGSGSYGYHWAWVSGGAGLSIGSPSAPSTTFTGPGMTPGTTYSGTCRCTVTDGYGQTATADVAVSITCNSAPVTGSYSGTLSVGTDGINWGYNPGHFGSINPTVDSNGHSIEALLNFEQFNPSNLLSIEIAGVSTQSYFTTLTVPGLGSFSSASASFSVSGGVATWTWDNGGTPTNGGWSFS